MKLELKNKEYDLNNKFQDLIQKEKNLLDEKEKFFNRSKINKMRKVMKLVENMILQNIIIIRDINKRTRNTVNRKKMEY